LSSDDEGAKAGKKKVAKWARKGSGMYTTHASSMVTDRLEDTTDENGMLNDVVVLELSDDDGEDTPKNGIKIPKNKNPMADIEEFWELVARVTPQRAVGAFAASESLIFSAQ
jgi:hypothetical protein